MDNSKLLKYGIIGGIALFLVIIVGYGIHMYNNLVQLDEAVPAQWAQVDNAYKRRADLIPELVSVVKGYAKHEKGTLESVIAARAKATQITVDPSNLTPEKLKQYQAAQGELSSALGKLLMIQEQYPDLKANKQFEMLMTQIEGSENRISTERHRFNESALEFNKTIRQFPNNLFGFEKHAYFEATDNERQAVKIEF